MKKHLLFLFAALLPLATNAHDFEVDGIYYNITSSTTAEVTFKGSSYDEYSNEYSGSINLPTTVTHEGKEYSVTSIGWGAFYECSSLTTINIPEGVTSIGDEAFAFCSSLTAINIPEGVTSIGNFAFYGCSSLTAINIPEGVTSIGGSAFSGCSNLTAINIPEGVTRIGYSAFSSCSGLTTINIPEGVTSIGDEVFAFCSSLTAITIPEGVTRIGYSAFEGCSSLKSVINYSDLNIKRGSSDNGYVGYYADRVINVDECIDGYAFKTVDGVHYLNGYIGNDTELTLPNSYNNNNYQIGESAFRYCSNLTAINIPESVTSIGEGAFYGCTGELFINCNIPSASSAYSGAFYSSEFTKVTIGEGVTSIGDYAFYECSSLTTITIPEGVTSIGNSAFSGCSSLTAITIPENSQLTSIGEYAFYGCSSLTTINIPESVMSIGNGAFYECSSLKEVTFGKGLKKIASGSFSGCSSIEKITIHATQPPATDGYIFDEAVYENATLYVPQGSIAKYQVMTGWSGFYNISEVEGGTPDYLTIRQADNGEVGIAVDLGRSYKVRITPSTGWTIHSVTFNGKDMTAQLSADNTFTTPTLTASAVLNVAYAKEGTAINNANASRLSVRGHNGIISISGAAEGEAITIYTLDGTMVASEEATDDTTSIEVPTQQVYIVKVADTVVKIGM